MTTNKNTKPAKPAESSSDETASSLNSDDATIKKGKTTLSALLKEALAAKNKKQQAPQNTKKIDKGQKIGMPPRGTRKSMGKR